MFVLLKLIAQLAVDVRLCLLDRIERLLDPIGLAVQSQEPGVSFSIEDINFVVDGSESLIEGPNPLIKGLNPLIKGPDLLVQSEQRVFHTYEPVGDADTQIRQSIRQSVNLRFNAIEVILRHRYTPHNADDDSTIVGNDVESQ